MASLAMTGKAMLLLLVGIAVHCFAPADAKDSPVPAIQRVITMLDNLIAEMDEEGRKDEEKFNHFMKWSANEIESTNVKILSFQAKIEELEASLSSLQATRVELVDTVKKLQGEVQEMNTQINFATEKRNTESQAFAAEQQEFTAAIAATGKAVTILASHYGDGSEPEPAARPDFMSLIETIRRAGQADRLKHHSLKAMKLLQAAILTRRGHLRQPNNDRYQAATGEAVNIVDQIKLLKESFAEDKQSAVEDEARLQKQYDSLMKEKTDILNSLVAERDTNQKRLDQTNQVIAEQEGELSRKNRELMDAQTYVASVTKNRNEFEGMYKERKEDREAETKACREAVDVLAAYRPSLLQRATVLARLSRGSARSRDVPSCKTCDKAAVLLRERATSYHSTLLQAAAAATEGSEALDEIISALGGLVQRLKVEQQAEKEHKEWCEKETGFTTAKRDDHSGIVDELKNVLANLSEVLEEKKDGIVVVIGDETDEEKTFAEGAHIREEDHEEYESDREEHVQAVAALNEAIGILAKFYANRKKAALLQTASGRQSARQPAMGGGKAVKMISEVRHEFEVSKEHIEKEEVEAQVLFETNKKQHIKVANDLLSEENQLTVEKQTTEEALDQNLNDKKDNEDEVKAAEDYLDRLGKSCYPLLMNYDDRVRQRKEEEQSLKDAIKVLREEA